jgi:hypothetical protein
MWNLSSSGRGRVDQKFVQAAKARSRVGRQGRRVRVASFLQTSAIERAETGALVAKGEPNSATIAMRAPHGKG